MGDEPKPCPFCGANASRANELEGGVEVGGLGWLDFWYVHCSVCEANGPTGETKVETVKLWNKRVTADNA